MSVTTTEQLHSDAKALDTRPLIDAARLLAEGQVAASKTVLKAVADICRAATAMAATIRTGGRLHYAAAGSSGLMAAADAQELGGTFSIPAEQLRIHMAGGLPTGVEMPGDTEDDDSGLTEALAGLAPTDTVIAVSASGTTPYTLTAAALTKAAGATLIVIANNPGAPLLQMADHPILLETPPELLSGSTRMGAGTTQKIALNMLSTLMAIDLGHVHDGMMVNLRADNAKLQARAAAIVTRIANVPPASAESALRATNGHVKSAALVALGTDPTRAENLLKRSAGHLRPALAELGKS